MKAEGPNPMDFKKIDENYAAKGQVFPQEMSEIADLGFKTVINNRPDGEEMGQPVGDDLKAAAEAAGLSYVSIPISLPTLTPELVAEHHAAMEAAGGPVFAFCRSGTRSTILWALTQVCFHGKSIAEVTSVAAREGYDLSGVEPLLEGYRDVLGR
ncbi:TIGR01244 family sulfur transferase [uncultured Nisaea sp.]|uniref:TIGR01244 family sulfur transferase n=1 Tax=Roseovarius sp. TaxID=1486281 RepID=UPI0030EF6844